ncbi:NifB/NifX family molybdenum-iron cluster-binding protein [Oceanobacter mangrovi]|uniref:NifB/NifX family molybdenum-iron cluster-binding protein n=1 Tax=Oceanobacter mangrovi TaxID=2862510 RepID=UPI001C8D8173|nr:NifB/NifX family molybdenum-iron cluster-binding protein [Oceanobacter mangrovi]
MTITRQLKVVDDRPEPIIRVAFASSDRVVVDQHFGSATAFVFYGLDFEKAWLLRIAEFEQPDMDSNEDKLADKIAMLDDCIAVYCRACGASAVRQLISHGVQPVKVSNDSEIADLLDSLLQELRSGPAGWLAKAMRSRTLPIVSRFDDMEAEGWSE